MDVLGRVYKKELEIALDWSEARLPEKYHKLVELYKKHGEKYNVRWSWAFAQACHETAAFRFSGDVGAVQNNFAGIGATGNGEPGEFFETLSDGVLAQIQHLACYAGVDIPPEKIVSKRTRKVKSHIFGKATTWEALAGKWAADSEYFEKIEKYYFQIFKPRNQEPGWYRLVEQNNHQKFFVAMSEGDALFKYPVKDRSISALADACNQLSATFPTAHGVVCESNMVLDEVEKYEGVPSVPDRSEGIALKPEYTEPPYFWKRSPNRSDRTGKITHIILHNTAGSFMGSINWLCNPASKVSAHLVIPRDGGKVAALVPERDRAWHAGTRKWNDCSIGIEITATKHERGLTKIQEKQLVQQIQFLLQKHKLTPDKILIHRQIHPPTPCPDLIWPKDSDFFAWRKRWFKV